MPTEACYVISIENAILLSVSYGILSLYFEDVMSYGYLFFSVFIGLCLCYVSMMVGFCLLLFDENTSKQLILFDANRPSQLTPNKIPTFARILGRSGAICSVALFVVFVTVSCEFFTEDNSEPDGLPTIALKRVATESQVTTQLAVSAALAIFCMVLLMLLCNNQQLNGIVVRLRSMTSPEQVAMTSSMDDLALFVRVLLLLYMIVCDSTGTFKPLPYKAMPSFLLGVIPNLKDSVLSLRNSISLVFIGWCWIVDIARAILPQTTFFLILVELLDVPQIFGNVLAFEVLLQDVTLTNFACLVLVVCDACCVIVGSFHRIFHILTKRKRSSHTRRGPAVGNPAPPSFHDTRTPLTAELHFNETDINVNNLRIFEKKSN